jgi:hypothetical protein
MKAARRFFDQRLAHLNAKNIMSAKIALNGLDPARTALVVVHMVKRVAGGGRHPFQAGFSGTVMLSITRTTNGEVSLS